MDPGASCGASRSHGIFAPRVGVKRPLLYLHSEQNAQGGRREHPSLRLWGPKT